MLGLQVRKFLHRGLASSSTASEFQPVVRAFFGKMDDGLQNMVETNPGLSITVENEAMCVDLGAQGAFMLQANVEERELTVLSPVSGVNTYTYDGGRDQWSSTADKHNLVELFTRDIMQIASGYPTF